MPLSAPPLPLPLPLPPPPFPLPPPLPPPPAPRPPVTESLPGASSLIRRLSASSAFIAPMTTIDLLKHTLRHSNSPLTKTVLPLLLPLPLLLLPLLLRLLLLHYFY